MIRSKDHIFDYRLHMAQSALTLGVKPTVRLYKTSAPTVRKWRDRFETEVSAGLRDRSRAPHSRPHKLSKEAEDTITKLRNRLPAFINAIEKEHPSRHVYNPPGCKNANADVESVHSTIEPEFFDIEKFRGRCDFFSKIITYQYYYNLARKNSSRGKKSSLTLLTEKAPDLDPRILILPSVDLCLLLSQGVNHVPSAPATCRLGRTGRRRSPVRWDECGYTLVGLRQRK